MLKEGDKAPRFQLESDSGQKVDSKDLAGNRYVVYFYPKDSTPGCTIEAIDFTKNASKFEKIGVKVFGVSRDSIKSHCSFRDKHALKIALLSDPDLTLHNAFGAFGEKSMYGKKIMGTIRSTFIVGPTGAIEKAYPSVKVAGHADAVLAFIAGGAATSAPSERKSEKQPASKKSSAKPAAKKSVTKPAARKPAEKKPAAKK
jgi:thioredoxin-dependent peroxiredoxin